MLFLSFMLKFNWYDGFQACWKSGRCFGVVFFFFKRENAVECVCKNYVNDEPKISMRVGSFLWPTGQMYKTIKPN